MDRSDALALLEAKLAHSSAEAGRLKVISNYLTEAVRKVGVGVSPDVVFVELEQKGIVC